MNKKLPSDAFEFYFGLGIRRSYQAVADKYAVSKKTVVARAQTEDWQKRVAEREQKAHEAADKKAVESLSQVNERHLKMLEVIQGKALQALKQLPLETAYQAMRAIVAAISQERVIRGEPADRIDVATIIKREYEALRLSPGEKDDWSDLERTGG
jgi:glutamate synthase domain-containing protein 2